MIFEKTIAKQKKKIDHKLKHFLEKRIRRMDNISPVARELMNHITEFNLRGGKRIRPMLVIEGYRACGGKSRAIWDAAIAVELMESYLLIHDDIMDQDELRRGYLTMHKVYEAKCKRKFAAEPGRFGESMALISGDILAVLGTEAILESDFPVKRKISAVDRFNKAVINTCIGQAMDIRQSCGPATDIEQIKKMYKLKTAIYTLEAPLHIGALLAGASKKQLRALTNYAIPLGQAYQLQDDILGLFGTREKIGKPIGSDLREGKKTLLLLETLKRASPAGKKKILSSLGSDISSKDVTAVKKIIKDTGALGFIREQAGAYATDAKRGISELGSTFLVELADYVVKREY